MAQGCVRLIIERVIAYLCKKSSVAYNPVANGTIYKAPNSQSVIAAKICLEGYSINTGILYFVNPSVSPSNWIISNRNFFAQIGNHAFYY